MLDVGQLIKITRAQSFCHCRKTMPLFARDWQAELRAQPQEAAIIGNSRGSHGGARLMGPISGDDFIHPQAGLPAIFFVFLLVCWSPPPRLGLSSGSPLSVLPSQRAVRALFRRLLPSQSCMQFCNHP